MAVKTNRKHETLIKGTSSADSIENYGYKVTISTGNGDDTVENIWDNDYTYDSAKYVSINTGAGNDYVYNYYGMYCTINTGAGNDSVYNYAGYYCTINTGAGNDSVYNEDGDDCTINTGAGNDSVYNEDGDDCTINTGAGNDLISLDNIYSKENVIIYKSGDGNDEIYGFDSDDTLSISGGSYSTAQSGSDIIVTVDDGQISLIGAADYISDSNIVFTQTVEENSWRLSGTTATYGTSSKTLVTVKGVKSLEGISLKNKVVTVAASALNKANVTLTGSGYKLKLASDVSTTAATSNAWSYKNSVATYKQTKGEKYSLASDGKTISYTAGTSKTLTKVSGIKSADGLSVSGKVVTISASALNKSKVTISNGYKLALASDVTTSTTKKAAWSLSNSTVSYKSSYKTAGYTLASNSKSISYSAGTTNKTLAKISGVKSASGLKINGKVITVPNSIIGASKKVSVSGSGSILLKGAADKTVSYISNGTATTFSANSSDEPYTVNGAAVILSNSYAEESFDVANVDGGNKIKTIDASAVKNNLRIKGNSLANSIKGGAGKITVQDAFEKEIGVTYTENGIEHDYLNGEQTVVMNEKKTNATITKNYWKTGFDFANFGKSISTVDATQVMHELRITGNDKANKILGGTGKNTLAGGGGNDTLQGGDKADIFVYNAGDGNDILYNVGANDTISIVSGTVDFDSVKGDTVILKIGDGNISIEGGAGNKITYCDEHGKTSKLYPNSNANVVETWFVEDDNFATDNDLSALVQNKAADYSVVNVESALRSANALATLTCSTKT